MYVCLCNPFTDRDVKAALERADVKKTAPSIYKACSGTGPNCGSCLCTIKDMIVDHQSARGVQKLKDGLPELTNS